MQTGVGNGEWLCVGHIHRGYVPFLHFVERALAPLDYAFGKMDCSDCRARTYYENVINYLFILTFVSLLIPQFKYMNIVICSMHIVRGLVARMLLLNVGYLHVCCTCLTTAKIANTFALLCFL